MKIKRSRLNRVSLWILLLATPLITYAFSEATGFVGQSIRDWSIKPEWLSVISANLMTALKITLTALYFITLGYPLTKKITTQNDQRGILNLAYIPLSFVIGELILFFYIYLRSIPVQFFLTTFELRVPLSQIELIIILIIIYLSLSKPELKSLKNKRHNQLSYHAILLFLLFLFALLTTERELPRLTPLSSDPDQHAYWASRIAHLGGTPPTTEPYFFGYPAGFAVLNASWMILSGLSAVEIVTIQPILQAMFAFWIMASLALLLSSNSNNTPNIQPAGKKRSPSSQAIKNITLYVFAFAIYQLFPYGYQSEIYHLEGAARHSSTALCAATIYLAALSFARQSSQKSIFLSFSLSVIAAFMLAINPAQVFIPLIALISIKIGEIIRNMKITTSELILLSLPLLMVAFVDSYYRDLLSSILLSSETPLLEITAAEISDLTNPPITLKTIINLFNLGLITNNSIWGVIITLLLPLMVTSLPRYRRKLVAFIPIAAILIIILAIAAHPILALAPKSGSLKLLLPYFLTNSAQYGFLLFLSTLFTTFVTIPDKILTLIIAPLSLIITFVSPLNPSLKGKIGRVRYCGSLGCASQNDLAAIDYVSRLASKLKSEIASGTESKLPKILIVSSPVTIAGENWLYPIGGSRILPLYNYLPVAFFYSQGSSEYTFENYLKNICQKTNRNWLKKRNIRYLFLADERGSVCFKEPSSLKPPATLLFSSGKSEIWRLF
ncbi:MAG TPA: hypothetical protein PKD37_07720 [Oligoflexia bacterium]|nr:hypothetical protein [Oligoflexia bacterium]HMP27851.1 hypothetical protein [Oligoflexia bacterium]